MEIKLNPFHELYVTETIGPDRFVNLFSPYLVQHSLALFQPGNMIVKGVKGSGKSMLLRLLSPETRIAYEKTGIEFPIPSRFRRYIGAGINLTRCGILDFGQRQMARSEEDENNILPIYFGDFLNYWVVLDILKTIETYINELDGAIAKELSITTDRELIDDFAIKLAKNDCWFAYHNNINGIDDLKESLNTKIQSYRSYLNFNINELPGKVAESKSGIGVPISTTIRLLKEQSIIPLDLNVFIKIDQYEELTRIKGIKDDVGIAYRQIVNKALGLREPQVSYRIGSRRYAWNDELQIYGTSSFLEEDRDYKIIDLDEMLRRKEYSRTWIFPGFAEDVFRRRIVHTGIPFRDDEKSILKKFIGDGLPPNELAKNYCGASPRRAISIENDWPEPWVNYLYSCAEDNPLSARLGEAWARQKDKKDITTKVPTMLPAWELHKYWVKERVHQALMQIAGRCSQRLIWCGIDDVLALSGGNILIFLSICQHIWSAWVRATRDNDALGEFEYNIPNEVQTIGIYEASMHWYENISTETGGISRQRFINHIGTIFYKSLYNDKPLSYPGHNGFSLKISEFDKEHIVNKFLNDAVDYGDLYDAPHTTKTKDHEKRRKWYLKPILSPQFRIPVTHTKEPMYLSIYDCMKLLLDSGAIEASDFLLKLQTYLKNKHKNEEQMTLFDKTSEVDQ